LKRTIRILSIGAGIALLPVAAFSQVVLQGASPEAFVEAQGGTSLLQDFQNGLITEVGIPALDAGARDAAKITIKISPEATRQKAPAASFKAEVQKRWLPSNFRLEIAGLDCRHVSKVESFTVKQGVRRDGRRGLEASPVVVWISEADARTWLDWANAPAGPRRERAFSLFLSDGTPARDVLEVRFARVTVRSVRRVEVGSAALRRFELEGQEPSIVAPPPPPAGPVPVPYPN